MTRKHKKRLFRITFAALLLIVAAVVEHAWLAEAPVWARLLLFLPAYLTVGYDVLWRAIRNVAHGQVFDENFLMTVATLGALFIGFLPSADAEFAEAVFVMIFYQLGELFQSIAVGKSRRSIAKLMEIRPTLARVLREDGEVEVAPEEVAVGALLSVRPGEKIPLDGVILSGSSDLNTVALTGESAPRAVREGDSVYSGSVNLTGALTVRVEKTFTESTVSRILSLMQEMGNRKSKSEQFITRFARFYTPFVVLSALLLAILPPILSGDFAAHFVMWFTRALTFLVVSCPCALVISVPLAFFGGVGGASRMGVLIKGSQHLEALAKTEIAVFDKTGTLTKGEFAVTRVLAEGISDEALLALAAAAEASSNHPLSRAILAACPDHPTPTRVTEVAGKGVLAEVNGVEIAVGNLALMQEYGLAPTLPEEGETAVFVARSGTYLGAILLSDQIKEGAREALVALRACGITHTVMLTGDRAAVAARVATELGVSDYRAELLPTDKVAAVESLLVAPHRGTLLFVGDGINDAPVLARADVGVAMGALGSDVAIEAADVVLMDDDPRKIARAVRHARRTLRIVRENVVLALGVKGAVLLLSALGLLGAWQMPLAIFADVGVAVIAILNAMRALHEK